MSRYVSPKLVQLFVDEWNNSVGGGPFEVWKGGINCGWCYQFAFLLRKLYGKKAQLCYDDRHAWVKIGRKYYDSSTLDGVDDIDGLAYRRIGPVRFDVSEERFVKEWVDGGSGDVQVNTIDKIVKKYRAITA